MYGGKITLEFEPVKHIYSVNGKRKISVTAVTGIIDKSAPLMGWVAKCMSEYLFEHWDMEKIKTEVDKQNLILDAKRKYRDISKKATNVGSIIHEWIEEWIAGKKPELPDSEQAVNGITAFLKWQKESKVKFIESEKILYSKEYNYCGKIDAVAKIDGEEMPVEFKSSNALYNEHRYQLAAYWLAIEEMDKKKFKYGMIIRFNKDTGNFDAKENIIKIPRSEYLKDKWAFIGALQIKRREVELKNLKK